MITCKKISKSYNKNNIIIKSDITVYDNRIAFLMGANGSGKTTLIKCIMGLETCEGSCTFDGSSLESIRNNCIVLYDDCPFYNNLTGLRNLELITNGLFSNPYILNIAQSYLNNELLKQKVKHYSYGQKKKLALSLIDIIKPRYIVMDEISNGLDYENLKFLKVKLIEWKKDSCILLTGHKFDFYNELIDDLYYIKDKKIVEINNFKDTGMTLGEMYDEKIYNN